MLDNGEKRRKGLVSALAVQNAASKAHSHKHTQRHSEHRHVLTLIISSLAKPVDRSSLPAGCTSRQASR